TKTLSSRLTSPKPSCMTLPLRTAPTSAEAERTSAPTLRSNNTLWDGGFRVLRRAHAAVEKMTQRHGPGAPVRDRSNRVAAFLRQPPKRAPVVSGVDGAELPH